MLEFFPIKWSAIFLEVYHIVEKMQLNLYKKGGILESNTMFIYLQRETGKLT